MTIQNLDFGTSAANDGEKLSTAFDKIQDNFVALYAADGTVTHAVTDVASAATCDIGAAATDRVRITGTVTITSLGTSASKLRFVHFSGALTLTHNATSLICIGAASILTVAGDVAILSSDADGNWRMLSFNRGASLATGDFSGPASSTDNAIVRFDGTNGKQGQNSGVAIDDSSNLVPVTTDVGALGTTALAWADAFFASGGTLHFADTDWVATHSTGILTVGTGDLRVTTAGTNTASVVTVGGTQTLTAKTLTSPTIGTSPTAAGATWADLGIVTTADINGGTLDGVTIGGSAAAAATVTTLTVNTNANPDADDGAALGTTALGWADLFLADGGAINWGNAGVTATHTAASDSLTIALDAANLLASTALVLAVDGTSLVSLAGTALSPAANDVAALGTTALGWADLHLATGALLNVANGDAVITHSTGVFTVSTGDLRVTTAGTNAASAVTVGGTQTLTNKTLTSPVITTPQINDTSADHQYVFAVSELAADRTVTLPLLGGADTFVFEAHTATLTNKTVDLTSNTLLGSVTEFNTALESADFATFAAVQVDNAAVRADGTAGLVQTSALIISDTADLTAYDATNDGNPVFAFGASATERLTVTPTYDTGAQTLDYVEFATAAASATANKGLFRFNVDGTAILDIDDGGINFAASKGISIAGTDILTDAAGTATLSNIDALDATTEATIEAAIDTLANLTSIQGVSFTFGAYAATLLNNASEAAFKAATNLEASTDYYAPGGTDVPVTDGGTGASTAADARTNLDTEQLGVQRAVNTQTASYTAVLADAGKVIEMNVAGANTLTIPANASVAYATGTWINIAQYGAGATTITPDAGVTIRNRSGLVTAGQYALATVYKRAANEWVAGGDLTA